MKYILDVDASKVIEAVRSTGVVITPEMRHYAHYLISNMKNIGTWQLSNAVYGMVGGTAGSHKWNWKDLRDVDAAFRLTFPNGMTHSASGMQGNGVNQYANTFLIPSSLLNYNDSHLSIYTNTVVGLATLVDIGANSGTGGSQIWFELDVGSFFSSTNKAYSSISQSYNLSFFPNNKKGFFLTTMTPSNVNKLFINGDLGSTQLSSGTNLPINPIYIGGRPDGNQYYTTRIYPFSSIGLGLTDNQATQQSQIVTNAQSILNRV